MKNTTNKETKLAMKVFKDKGVHEMLSFVQRNPTVLRKEYEVLRKYGCGWKDFVITGACKSQCGYFSLTMFYG